MDKRLYLFTGVLVLAMLGLLLLLIYWGRKSIELRKALFLDQVEIAVNDWIQDEENGYYCFDLRSDFEVPKMQAFYLLAPPVLENTNSDTVPLLYEGFGKSIVFSGVPISSVAHLDMQLHFEFKNIPEFRDEASLNDFERYIRSTYTNYLLDKNGVRLIDTTQFDSLLNVAVQKVNSDAEISYFVRIRQDSSLIYRMPEILAEASFVPHLITPIYSSDRNIPTLDLHVRVDNIDDLFGPEAWNAYLSATLLTLLAILLVLNLVKMFLQQRKTLNIQRDFVHGMTHEFNTPLSSIKFAAQNLTKSVDEKTNKMATIIRDESNKLQSGINLVLTTALIDRDELLLDKEEINLNQLLIKVIEKNATNLKEADIEIDRDLPDTSAILSADPFHIENVFQNLISNIRKHSSARNARIWMSEDQGSWYIRFADDGKGISESERKKIFWKFQNRARKGMKNGYGLGLYYSRMIVNLHGGDIRLEPNGSTGSTFCVQLPK